MIEHDLGQGGKWYIVAREFPTALMAKTAWERAMAKLDIGRGIGVLRIGPNPDGGISNAVDGKQRNAVLALSLDRDTALHAERVIAGEEWTPTDDFILAMILRRAQIVMKVSAPGRVIIRRPEGRGAQMDRFGQMHERKGEG